MLNTIEETWKRGRRAVQQQKESFEELVDAFYPRFATEKLLAGECPIVVQAPEASVFFSDICHFSAITNRLTAPQMLEWLGYVFGVMDTVAAYYGVFKVSTVGDAYFAICGPPGLTRTDRGERKASCRSGSVGCRSGGLLANGGIGGLPRGLRYPQMDHEGHALRMLRFASDCVQ
eukprot:RCo024751